MLKRAFDFIVASFLLILLFPLLFLVAALIKLGSKGPVFYRGIRSGLNGRTFKMLKFRTMVVEAARMPEGTTGKDDPRVTRVGKTIRRLKIDELPQLINVIKGEMSLVGPRPELPRYTSQYTAEQRQILSVRPGITDLSSIRFSSLDEVVGADDVDRVFEERVLPMKNALRLRYVRERSFVFDLRILIMTVVVVSKKLLSRSRA